MSTPSLWQLQAPSTAGRRLEEPVAADVCVVGAGVTGGACAWRLLEHGLSVAVLDARAAAASASGRNGGFAVTGTALGHPELAARLGDAAAMRLHRASERALEELVETAAELGVPEAVRRTGSLWIAAGDEADELRAAVTALGDAGIECERADGRVPEPMRGRYTAAAFFPLDAELQPALWVRTLVAAAAARGASVWEGSPVRGIERDGAGWAVHTPEGSVSAQAAVLACDGLIPRVAPWLGRLIYPVRGQVLATEVLPPERRVLELPAHSDHGFMYYRPTSEGRIVLGGGRMADLEGEYTDEEATSEPVQAALDRFLAEQLGLDGVAVEHRWAGVMGFSADLLPLAGELPGRPGLHVCGGYSGVGNTHGWQCGRMVADLIATGSHPLAADLTPARFGDRPAPEALEKRRSRALRSS